MLPWLRKNKAFYSSKRNSVESKGLTNQPGQNNCFLNSAVQVLWHLDAFRTNFLRLTGHSCEGEYCIFCALKSLFSKFKYGYDHILPPTELREALADAYQEQNRFQLGLMDDAAECFENLLLRIHTHIAKADDSMCTAKHCISHQKFGMMLIEQGICSCGEATEPLPFVQLVHYVSAALCTKLENWRQSNHGAHDIVPFGKLVRSAGTVGGRRDCPSKCGNQIETKTTLMNCPDVVSIGINWDSSEPSVRHIADLLHTIDETIKLQDMFHKVLDKAALKNTYHLSGLVCYYGSHYSTFLYNRKSKRWISIDDASVTDVGKKWGDVFRKCIKGHYQPLLLLYANWSAVAISLEDAPMVITKAPSSVKSSPSPSRKDDTDVASSSSSGSPTPSPAREIRHPNGAATRSKFQWGWNNVSQPITKGHYVEPKTATWTTYKAYAKPSANNTLEVPSTNSNRGKGTTM